LRIGCIQCFDILLEIKRNRRRFERESEYELLLVLISNENFFGVQFLPEVILRDFPSLFRFAKDVALGLIVAVQAIRKESINI
jgi:hypothetical protein